MTNSQICAICTDRACHLCPVTKQQCCPNTTDGVCCHAAVRRVAMQDATPCARCEFRTGTPSAKRLNDLFGDVATQTFAPLAAPAHRHDVELDLYEMDLDRGW